MISFFFPLRPCSSALLSSTSTSSDGFALSSFYRLPCLARINGHTIADCMYHSLYPVFLSFSLLPSFLPSTANIRVYNTRLVICYKAHINPSADWIFLSPIVVPSYCTAYIHTSLCVAFGWSVARVDRLLDLFLNVALTQHRT